MAKTKISTFKIVNRGGYAAICKAHLTEGRSKEQAVARMLKALKRTARKK